MSNPDDEYNLICEDCHVHMTHDATEQDKDDPNIYIEVWRCLECGEEDYKEISSDGL